MSLVVQAEVLPSEGPYRGAVHTCSALEQAYCPVHISMFTFKEGPSLQELGVALSIHGAFCNPTAECASRLLWMRAAALIVQREKQV